MKNPSTLDLVFKTDADTRAVRVVIRNGDPWFVAADVSAILGYASSKDATRLLADDEKGGHNLPTLGGTQSVTVINESGLYQLIFRSRRAEAQSFRKWVTSEVLPTIRRTGSYALTTLPLESDDPLTLALRATLDARQRLDHVETEVSSLRDRLDTQPIHGKQRRRIRELCQQLGRELGDYSKAYRLLWDKFELASYTDLPSSRFEEAERFLLGLIAAYSGQDRLVDE